VQAEFRAAGEVKLSYYLKAKTQRWDVVSYKVFLLVFFSSQAILCQLFKPLGQMTLLLSHHSAQAHRTPLQMHEPPLCSCSATCESLFEAWRALDWQFYPTSGFYPFFLTFLNNSFVKKKSF